MVSVWGPTTNWKRRIFAAWPSCLGVGSLLHFPSPAPPSPGSPLFKLGPTIALLAWCLLFTTCAVVDGRGEGELLCFLALELDIRAYTVPPSVACYLPRASETHPADVCGFSSFISTAVKSHGLNTPYFIYPISCGRTSRSFLGGFLGCFCVFFCYYKQRY